jgi:polysaccharide biosynthesis protein PslE
MIAAPHSENPLRAAARVLWRHKSKSICFFLIVLSLGVVAAFFMPKTYRSEGKLLLRLGRENMAIDPTATVGSSSMFMVQPTRESEINSVLEVFRSRVLVEKVVDAIGPDAILAQGKQSAAAQLSSDAQVGGDAADTPSKGSVQNELVNQRDEAIRWLTRAIDVENVRKSNVVQVTCDAGDPRLAQELVSKLIDSYLAEHIRLNRTPGAQEFLSQQTDNIRARLDAKQQELRALKNETGLSELNGRRTIVMNRMGRLEDDLLLVSTELSSTKAEVAQLKEQLKTLPANEVTEQTVGFPNEAADGMRQQLYALQIKEQEMATKLTDAHPQLVQVREQIADAQKVLDAEEPQRKQTRTGLSKPHEEVKLLLLKQQPLLAALQAKNDSVVAQLGVERTALAKLNDDEVKVAQLQREVDVEELNFRKYSESLEQSRIDGALALQGKSNVSIVQPATLDLKPVKPKKLFTLAIAFILGVAGAVGLAFFADALDDSIRTSHEAERHLAMPTLATIGRLKPRQLTPTDSHEVPR